MLELGQKIAGANNWSSDELREKRNRQNEIAQRSRRLQYSAINVERVRKRMESVKRNADREQNIEMRRLIDHADTRKRPLKILKQKIPVFEKAEHAQVHANAGHQPTFLAVSTLRFGDLPAEPEIHRRRCEKERGEGRIPGAVKNVTRHHEQVFSQLPSAQAPVERDDDYKKNDEGERIKKHERCGSPAFLAEDSKSASTFCRLTRESSFQAIEIFNP